MPKIKDIPQIDRPREKFLKMGANAMSKSDLLAILLGSGIKGKNVKQLSEQIIKKFGQRLLEITTNDLMKVEGIGQAKALQIVAAISLVKRLYEDKNSLDIIIKNSKDVLSVTYDLNEKRKEYLVCLYLNARHVLIKKETVSIGLLDKSLIHPREIFYPAVELNSASVILVHNHPTGNPTPSSKDKEVINKIIQAGEIMGIPVIDFIITAKDGNFSFYDSLKKTNVGTDYVAEGVQDGLFELLQIEKPVYDIAAEKIYVDHFYKLQTKENYIQLQNRRYIGSKQKLLDWIFTIINKECSGNLFADIFAGTGVVSAFASNYFKEIIINDFLYSNYVIYQAFFGDGEWDSKKIENLIKNFNNIFSDNLPDNYFSENFGDKYFSRSTAKVIGFIREYIEKNKNYLTNKEYCMLIASLIYAMDKVANTVGHYDAYFRKEYITDRFFMRPIDPIDVKKVTLYREDANLLAKRIKADIVYVDPPYNSRQYSRFYHVLETLTKWEKPKLYGTALKPEPENISDYCKVQAKDRLTELVRDLDAKYLVVSYNNTYDSKSNSSKNKITLQEIKNILTLKGRTKVFEKDYRHFNAGNTEFNNHKEYLFVTKIGYEQQN